MLTKHCSVQNPSTDNLSAADIYRSKKITQRRMEAV